MTKRWTISFSTTLAVCFALGLPLAAQADQGAPPTTPMSTRLTPTEMAAMHAQMGHVETLIEKINKVYHTQFGLAPKAEAMAMAMAHMAAANMEMSKAMMEMQEFWSATPPAEQYPAPRGGQ